MQILPLILRHHHTPPLFKFKIVEGKKENPFKLAGTLLATVTHPKPGES